MKSTICSLRDFFLSSSSMPKANYRFFTGFAFDSCELKSIGAGLVTDFLRIPPAGQPPGHLREQPVSQMQPLPATKETPAREAAVKLEASFLSEMLKAAGFGAREGAFSGGAGEDQFASLYRDAVAEQMARSGALGLSDHFFRSILEAHDDRN